jgi:NADPH:quinone reductase-like Zn-dependent oxidoreductase
VKADYVALKPRNLSFIEAAAIPVDGITAHQALVDEMGVGSGETVHIAGAAGGVGTLAVQIAAKILGSRVLATAGPANIAYVRALGATDVFDYTAGDFVAAARKAAPSGVDAALDCVGKDDNAKKTIAAVRDGGRLAELVGEQLPEERGIRIAHIESAPSAKRLDTLRPLFENGTLHVHIAQTFQLADARNAQQVVETRHTRGKIVLVVDCRRRDRFVAGSRASIAGGEPSCRTDLSSRFAASVSALAARSASLSRLRRASIDAVICRTPDPSHSADSSCAANRVRASSPAA